MKKHLIIVALFILWICGSCSKAQEQIQDISISLDYTLPEIGDMGGRSGAALYSEFYAKYISTRKLTPTTYTLTFTNTNDGSSITINDRWADGHGLKLPIGTYKVEGSSSPKSKYIGQYEKGLIDTLWLKFSEEIEIKPEITRIKLRASYDSFMLFFDAEEISSIESYVVSTNEYNDSVAQVDAIYYLFLQSVKVGQRLVVYRKNGGSAVMDLGKMALEKGKYYYFGDIGTEYDLPEMENGN